MSASINVLTLKLSRLFVNQAVQVRSFHTQKSPLLFNVSQQLWAEPLKKKKKMQAGGTHKGEKNVRKLEKELKKMSKSSKRLKPIDEFEESFRLQRLAKIGERLRERPEISPEVQKERSQLIEEWSKYQHQRYLTDEKAVKGLLKSQQRALRELRKVSRDLYRSALKIDKGMNELVLKGPVATPPIKDYVVGDGDYVNTTRSNFKITIDKA